MIEGSEDDLEGALLFFAGVGRDADSRLVTSGGRVFNVVGMGPTIADARAKAYGGLRRVSFAGIDLDPGVLCSRDRMEAVARKNPATFDDLVQVVELRNWQRSVLGEGFLSFSIAA